MNDKYKQLIITNNNLGVLWIFMVYHGLYGIQPLPHLNGSQMCLQNNSFSNFTAKHNPNLMGRLNLYLVFLPHIE